MREPGARRSRGESPATAKQRSMQGMRPVASVLPRGMVARVSRVCGEERARATLAACPGSAVGLLVSIARMSPVLTRGGYGEGCAGFREPRVGGGHPS